MSVQIECICRAGGYNRSCPYVFETDGKMFHTLDGINSNSLPSIYKGNPSQIDGKLGFKRNVQSIGGDSEDSWEREFSDDEISSFVSSMSITKKSSPDPLSIGKSMNDFDPRKSVNQNLKDNCMKIQNLYPETKNDPAFDLTKDKRNTLQKFGSLSMGGKTINDFTINGFTIDVPDVAEKLQELAPLPPSNLPKIFCDDDLNFYHHFYNGLSKLLGKEYISKICNEKVHLDSGETSLCEEIMAFMQGGFSRDDDEITLFVKKVLRSTFRLCESGGPRNTQNGLTVQANLWGFRYIEPRMQLKDAEVCMWISMCYHHYRTLWFDTFKSSGIPGFALEGVAMDIKKERRDDYLEQRDQVYRARVPAAMKRHRGERKVNGQSHLPSNKKRTTTSWF